MSNTRDKSKNLYTKNSNGKPQQLLENKHFKMLQNEIFILIIVMEVFLNIILCIQLFSLLHFKFD